MNTRRFFAGPALVLMVALVWAGCAGTQQASSDPDVNQWVTLYDGSSLEGWTQAGPGHFEQQADGSILGRGGMGLFYYEARPFKDFVLELDWKAATDSANAGIFVRFPEKTDDPWYAVNNGYEIQIDDSQDPLHVTGSVYSFQAPLKKASKPAGEWNTYRIEVRGQRYQIYLNGEKVNDFIGNRGRQGYIGLQNHDDLSKVWYRNIRVMPLPEGGPETLADVFRTNTQADPINVLVVTATHGFRHKDAIETATRVLGEIETTTEFEFDFTEDVNDLNAQNLAKYDVLFFNNSTLRIKADKAIPGVVATWDVQMNSSRGNRTGKLVLRGEPGAYTASVAWDGGNEAELRDVTFENDKLTFAFGNEGQFKGQANVVGDKLEGEVVFGDNKVALTGTYHDGTRTAGIPEGTVLVTEAQRQAIMDFLRQGKGIAVAHAGLDAFYGWDEYKEMVGGGLFEEHPWTQHVEIVVEETDNPATEHLGESFSIRDEIYTLDENPRWNSRVLLSLDMESVGVVEGPADIGRNDHPISWIRKHNGGRVFVTKLGHFADNWKQPDFLQHVLQGIRMAAGRIPADFSGQRIKEVIVDNVWPDDIAVDERGNVWIAELTGRVLLYDAATGQTREVAKINTTDPVNIEHGLFGIEVDPEFYNGQPYVYVFYAEPETFINTLSRFEFRDGKFDMSTETVLLRVPTEPACCHQAGDLEWGPDGTLFVSTGDTGQSSVRPQDGVSEEEVQAFVEKNNLSGYHWSRLVDSERTAQNLQELRGKILRINKDGSIPKDNPFFGQPGVRWEIYAYGLRNPYRFKVDDKTGYVYIGVVGPDEVTTYDEYNVSMKGGENFGWPRDNGKLLYNEWKPEMIPNWTPSMWEYTYATGGRSATFGPIYRSDGEYAFPAAFQEKVFVFDWARRWIKWADVEDRTWTNDTTGSVKAYPYSIEVPAKRLTNIKLFDVLPETTPISMELAPDGTLYVAEFDGFWGPGPNAKVTRYRWISDDNAPASQTSANSGAGASSGK